MHSEEQQGILNYFIEEARHHLNSIEQGLLNLQEGIDNSEMINKIFRAAHSIKGGAAILGLNSIEYISERLEDFLKVIKDQEIKVDPKLESLLLDVCDKLKILLDHLGSPFGLLEETANGLIAETELLVIKFNDYLEKDILQSNSESLLIITELDEVNTDGLNLNNLNDLSELSVKDSLDIKVSEQQETMDITINEIPINENRTLNNDYQLTDMENNINSNEYDFNSFWIDNSQLNTAEIAKDAAKELEESLFASSLSEVELSFQETVTISQRKSERTKKEAGLSQQLLSSKVSEDDLFAELDKFYSTSKDTSLGEELLPSKVSEDDLFADLDKFYSSHPVNYESKYSRVSAGNIRDYELLSGITDEVSNLEESVKKANLKINLLGTELDASNSKIQRSVIFPKVEDDIKVSVKELNELSNLVGELVVSRNKLEHDHERLRLSVNNLLIQIQHLSDVRSKIQELYERSLAETSILSNHQGNRGNTDFTELEMEQFTSFHSLSQETIEYIVRLKDFASDIDFVSEETEQVVQQFRKVTSQLQEKISKVRMVSFIENVERLRRNVKNSGIKYGKQVQLVIEGSDVLVDRIILDHLIDPFTYILNYAIAYGIERPEKRIAAGKSSVGKIKIRAFQEDHQIVITINDDGVGIDHKKLIQQGIQKGLITLEDSKTISRQEVYELLFLENFSTGDEMVREGSPGVNMNVIKTHINEIRGTISTDSVIGKGTMFTIRLPLSLSVCKALYCVYDKLRIAFPMDGVEDILAIKVKDIHKNANGQSLISWGKKVLALHPLREILVVSEQSPSTFNVYSNMGEDEVIFAVVLRSGNVIVAIQVDEVLKEEEIVIKQFEKPVLKPLGIAGATIMGDGRVIPIADVLEICKISHDN